MGQRVLALIFRQTSKPLTFLCFPKRKAFLVPEKVADLILQAETLRIFSTEVLVTRAIAGHRNIAAKVPDGRQRRLSLAPGGGPAGLPAPHYDVINLIVLVVVVKENVKLIADDVLNDRFHVS